jgi:DNA-binding FrmR family transcriptional regulator
MDSPTRKEALKRLKLIAGQVTGVERMITDDRYCVDVLLQVASVQSALGEVGRIILKSHVENCLAEALRSNKQDERLKKIDELMDIFSRYCALGSRTRNSRNTPE